jgi:hypothetical protein
MTVCHVIILRCRCHTERKKALLLCIRMCYHRGRAGEEWYELARPVTLYHPSSALVPLAKRGHLTLSV